VAAQEDNVTEQSLVVRFKRIEFDAAWTLYGGGAGQVGVWYKLRDEETPGRVEVVTIDGEHIVRDYHGRSVLVVADVVHLPWSRD
jgi:hypothetical protein